MNDSFIVNIFQYFNPWKNLENLKFQVLMKKSFPPVHQIPTAFSHGKKERIFSRTKSQENSID